MVEIFRTNVQNTDQALRLTKLINDTFSEYAANFDLEDEDKILRIKSNTGTIHHADILTLIDKTGFKAEVLPDNYPLQTIIHGMAG
jgi:hypothetical protein